MNCKKAHKYFQKFLNNQMPVGKSEEFNTHVDNCGYCKKILDEVENTLLVDYKNSASLKDEYFYNRLMAKINNNEQRKAIVIFNNLKPVAASVLVAAAFVFGIFLGSSFIKFNKTNTYTSSTNNNTLKNINDNMVFFNLNEVEDGSPEDILLNYQNNR